MSRVPYKRLRAAERTVAAAFPDAFRVKALWTPQGENDIVIEVWETPRMAFSVALA